MEIVCYTRIWKQRLRFPGIFVTLHCSHAFQGYNGKIKILTIQPDDKMRARTFVDRSLLITRQWSSGFLIAATDDSNSIRDAIRSLLLPLYTQSGKQREKNHTATGYLSINNCYLSALDFLCDSPLSNSI